GGPDMTLNEVNEATAQVSMVADTDAEMIFGAVIDESMSDQIRVTIIATGFPEDIHQIQQSEEKRQTMPRASDYYSISRQNAQNPLGRSMQQQRPPAAAALPPVVVDRPAPAPEK